MKTVTVTFEKAAGTLTARLGYEHDSYPRTIELEYKLSDSGNTSDFKLGGREPGMHWPLKSLQKHVEWQAEQMGASVLIKEDDGKVWEWTDNLGSPS